MIYFLQSPDGGTVKIGTALDVDARHKQLEAQYRQPLALLATLPGGREEERAIHERFASHRLGKTEQFRPVAEIMAFLGRPLLVSPDPDAVELMPGSFRTLGIRMSHEYAEWLTGVAKADRMTIAAFVDKAVADRAKAIGHAAPPPERIP